MSMADMSLRTDAERTPRQEETVTVGCVILTMGDRSDELHNAITSILRQSDVDVDVMVVVNGPQRDIAVPQGTQVHYAGRNLGIPAGRNLGARRVTGDVLLFLDDDAEVVGADTLCRAVDRFVTEPALGVVSLRVIDPAGGPGARRHVPRLRVGDPAVGSEVTTFLGGACIMRREVLEGTGGFPNDFFYAHEETSLAWRALDAGWRIRYAGDLAVSHPATIPARHARYYYLTARNRVLLARRHLPWAMAALYLTIWSAASLVRARHGGLVPTMRGLVEGFRHPRGPRTPISWRTVARMTMLGRPPIV